ncbi:MAG: site-specific integrase [Actinomycetota bacterium]|nr:site-specific integrase [Actinomycetota bacterium]
MIVGVSLSGLPFNVSDISRIAGVAIQRVELGSERTWTAWTVVGSDHLLVGLVEEFLEYLLGTQYSSPNTIRSYATALSRWWDYLTTAELAWDEVSLPTFIPFLISLRTGDPAGVSRLPVGPQPQAPVESVVSVRVTLGAHDDHEPLLLGAPGFMLINNDDYCQRRVYLEQQALRRSLASV